MDITLILLSINFLLLGCLALHVASLWSAVRYVETRISHINTSLDELDKRLEDSEDTEHATRSIFWSV